MKYRSAGAGAIKVQFRSIWADRNGTHMTPMDNGAIDTVCTYCPETDECYYVRPDAHGTSVTLRIAPRRNGQLAGVLDAGACRWRLPIDLGGIVGMNDAQSGAWGALPSL